MKPVTDAFALVEKNFADPINSEKAFYGDNGRGGAIPGMLHTLDPHSNFVDPLEYREMQRRQHVLMHPAPPIAVVVPFSEAAKTEGVFGASLVETKAVCPVLPVPLLDLPGAP